MEDAHAQDSPLKPEQIYQERITQRKEELRRWDQREGIWGTGRVLTFLAIFVVGYLTSATAWEFTIGVVGSIIVFLVTIKIHQRIVRRQTLAALSIRHYRNGLRRLRDQWAGHGPTGKEWLTPNHPYAYDLDLFGKGSLFQLLCTAKTPMGQAKLANWLLHPAENEQIKARHEAIDELREKVDLREEVGVIESEERRELHPGALMAWIDEPPLLVAWFWPTAAMILGLAAALSLIGWQLWGWGLEPFAIILLAETVVVGALFRRLQAISSQVDTAFAELEILAHLLKIFEKESYQSPLLQQLREKLGEGDLPSKQIAKLNRWIRSYENALKNQFFAAFAFLFQLTILFAWGIERWRMKMKEEIPDWLETIGTWEALLSLSGYAFENPEHPFPELESDRCLIGKQIGHPLLPRDRCIRNDLDLSGPLQLMIVSGSNMSGKSTLLRSVGLNVVLSLAGAPVRAKRFQLSNVQLASSMRIQDSLQEGISHFYAEIKRLREIVDLSVEEKPVLFLLDELLHGTNSHDRRVGAEGVIRKLLAKNAFGFVTTHDLALAELANRLGDQARNVHFSDQLVDGKMVFDYQMKEGVVPKSNALALMRLLGLEV
ncbi:DNA mismatch repair protein MutS [Planctomycetales bacterium 10988]|nr:DNA mismatch repair protein MutS [Planctomycetales bacterium 10988]